MTKKVWFEDEQVIDQVFSEMPLYDDKGKDIAKRGGVKTKEAAILMGKKAQKEINRQQILADMPNTSIKTDVKVWGTKGNGDNAPQGWINMLVLEPSESLELDLKALKKVLKASKILVHSETDKDVELEIQWG